MNNSTKSLLTLILRLVDCLFVPFVFIAALLLKIVRRAGVQRMPLSKNTMLKVGVFPVLDHYYEPLIYNERLRFPLDQDRKLTGVDWNISEQLNILRQFCFGEEIKFFQKLKTKGNSA